MEEILGIVSKTSKDLLDQNKVNVRVQDSIPEACASCSGCASLFRLYTGTKQTTSIIEPKSESESELKSESNLKECNVSLDKFRSDRSKLIIANNPIRACESDIVKLKLEDQAIIKSTFYLVIIPLLIFVGTCLVGSYFKLEAIFIFLVSILFCFIFYSVLRTVFKYKTYYTIVSKR